MVAFYLSETAGHSYLVGEWSMCMNTHLCTSIGCNQLMTNNPLSSIIWVIDKKIVQMSFVRQEQRWYNKEWLGIYLSANEK